MYCLTSTTLTARRWHGQSQPRLGQRRQELAPKHLGQGMHREQEVRFLGEGVPTRLGIRTVRCRGANCRTREVISKT
jgi:hypothetical protein